MKRQTLLFLCLLATCTFAEPLFRTRAAWGGDALQSAPEEKQSGSNFGTWLVGFYRETVSKVDGDRCPSEPSCSEYSLQAFRKHGFLIGWVMTVDRLIHEGREEARVSPLVHSGGKRKIYDPVENNDFWWYIGDRKKHD